MRININELLDNLSDLQAEYECDHSNTNDHIQRQIAMHLSEFVGRLRETIEESTDHNGDQEELPL